MTVPLKENRDGLLVFDREEAFRIIIERDGPGCAFPGCTHPFVNESGSPWHRTLDHIKPQAKARAEGWEWEEIWDTDNLSLMHRICNQRKGDIEYSEDGTLTIVEVTRRVKLVRPDICSLCYAGRLLTRGEVCPDCGTKPQPSTWPAYLQKDPRECSHDRDAHCRFCVPGFTPRIEPLAL